MLDIRKVIFSSTATCYLAQHLIYYYYNSELAITNKAQEYLLFPISPRRNPDGLTVQQIRSIAVNVANVLNSGNPDKEFEGQTALSVLPDLVGFQNLYRWADASPIADIDVETKDAIIEVTSASRGKYDQINDLLNIPIVNPRRKPVILFAPRFTLGAFQVAERVDPSYVYCAKTWQQLKKWLLLLRD
jgi:hypothetical protein